MESSQGSEKATAPTPAPRPHPEPSPRPRFPDEPGWPSSNGARVVFLLDASSRLERELLEDWIARNRPAGSVASVCDSVAIAPSRRRRRGKRGHADGRLEACLAGDDDPLLAPLRVAWERDRTAGVRESPLRELLTVGDPRDPGTLRQGWILRRHPDRCRIVAGEPARASELRERWRQLGASDATSTSGLSDFVARQATLALERAERRIRGAALQGSEARPRGHPLAPGLPRRHSKARARAERARGAVAARAARYLREMAATHSPFLIELSRSSSMCFTRRATRRACTTIAAGSSRSTTWASAIR